MTATLATIRAAITTALTALVSATEPQPSGTLNSVQQWSGEINRTQPLVDLDALGRTPAAMVCFARESYRPNVQTLTGETELLGASEWVVFVACNNVLEPATVTTSMDALLSAAVSALAELPIDGLYGNSRCLLADLRPYRVRPGTQVYALTLRAVRQITEVSFADNSEPLTDVQGSENIVGSGTLTNVNPLSRTRNQFP